MQVHEIISQTPLTEAGIEQVQVGGFIPGWHSSRLQKLKNGDSSINAVDAHIVDGMAYNKNVRHYPKVESAGTFEFIDRETKKPFKQKVYMVKLNLTNDPDDVKFFTTKKAAAEFAKSGQQGGRIDFDKPVTGLDYNKKSREGALVRSNAEAEKIGVSKSKLFKGDLTDESVDNLKKVAQKHTNSVRAKYTKTYKAAQRKYYRKLVRFLQNGKMMRTIRGLGIFTAIVVAFENYYDGLQQTIDQAIDDDEDITQAVIRYTRQQWPSLVRDIAAWWVGAVAAGAALRAILRSLLTLIRGPLALGGPAGIAVAVGITVISEVGLWILLSSEWGKKYLLGFTRGIVDIFGSIITNDVSILTEGYTSSTQFQKYTNNVINREVEQEPVEASEEELKAKAQELEQSETSKSTTKDTYSIDDLNFN